MKLVPACWSSTSGAIGVAKQKLSSALSHSPEVVPMAVTITKRRFTVVEYEKMAEAGILRDDERVELIEGEIIDMTPNGRGHQADFDRLNQLFSLGLSQRAIVRVQGSVRLSKRSEPQPDLVLLRYREDFYANADAGPEDVLLLVEVADASLSYDRDVKLPLYARAGIPEVWLVDINRKSIDLHREPGPQGYQETFTARGDESLSPQAFREFVLTANQVLG
jgi:Uma2 family endonuclease